MHTNIKRFLTPILFVLYLCHTAQAGITDYHQTFIPGFANDHFQIAIRTYYKDNNAYFLVVNPDTLATYEVPANKFRERRDMTERLNPPRYYTWERIKSKPYINALLNYTSSPLIFEKNKNQGITHAEYATEGMFLTIDMCPSTKYFDKALFQSLVKLSNEKQQPIPIAIAISGLWLLEHQDEFNWIAEQIKQNKLAVTWINHSFSHVYYGDLALEKNFLLFPYTNITLEILETEKILLENGQLPSVFFRFPGLISNKEWMLQLQKFGLIPIGSNAWLAAQQDAKGGSIILVHGNSNEPEGIKLLMPLINQQLNEWLPITALLRSQPKSK